MSRDAKNSILVWAVVLAFFGLVWLLPRLDLGVDIPDQWFWGMAGVLLAANILKAIWDFIRRRRTGARRPSDL